MPPVKYVVGCFPFSLTWEWKRNYWTHNISLEKAGVILVRRKKKLEELIMPTLLFSSFQTSPGCMVKEQKILQGEKRRLLPDSALGQAGGHIGFLKAAAWLLLKLSHWEQVRCKIEPQMMPLLHYSQGHAHIEWFWFFLMWNCAFPILACFCFRQYFSI